MDREVVVDDKSIIEYVKSAKLKGTISFKDYGFVWNLESLDLEFIFNNGEMVIAYYTGKNYSKSIGHEHVDNEDVIELIKEINREDKMVKITYFLGASMFDIVDKTEKRKKSWFLVRRYYSC